MFGSKWRQGVDQRLSLRTKVNENAVRRFLTISAVLALMLSFQNCEQVSYVQPKSPQATDAASAGDGSGDDTAGGDSGGLTSPTPTPTPTVATPTATPVAATPTPAPSTPTPAPTPTPTPVPTPTPGPNLVTNPGFESVGAGWENWGNTTILTGIARSGAYASQSGTAGGGVGQDVISKLQVGATYRAEVYARVGSTSEKAWFGVKFENSSGQVVQEFTTQVTGTSYQSYALQFKVPSGASRAALFIWKDTGPSYVYADDFSLRMVAP